MSCVFAVAAKLKGFMAHPGGGPRIQFDLALVEGLGRIYATAWEMAAFFGCSERTIERQMDNNEGEFWRAYNRGSSTQNLRWRAKFLEVAMRGNCQWRNIGGNRRQAETRPRVISIVGNR
jgi:hypothetical protein